MLTKKQIKEFQEKILGWYEHHQRDLPWREVPVGTSLQENVYRILVSEIMSQQTQLSRVVPKYEAWMKKFPTVGDLANAKTADVLKLWSGLGYNRRALYLQRAAQAIVSRSSSSLRKRGSGFTPRVLASVKRRPIKVENDKLDWPQTVEELEKLPGVGKYTASAIACFAFNKQMVVIDTNVRKVILLEFFDGQEKTEKEVAAIAVKLLPPNKAYEWNQALMDYSSLVLKKEKVPLKRQAKLYGSNRYYRGRIMKKLVGVEAISVVQAHMLFENDSIQVQKEKILTILQSLVKDGLVKEISPGVFSFS